MLKLTVGVSARNQCMGEILSGVYYSRVLGCECKRLVLASVLCVLPVDTGSCADVEQPLSVTRFHFLGFSIFGDLRVSVVVSTLPSDLRVYLVATITRHSRFSGKIAAACCRLPALLALTPIHL